MSHVISTLIGPLWMMDLTKPLPTKRDISEDRKRHTQRSTHYLLKIDQGRGDGAKPRKRAHTHIPTLVGIAHTRPWVDFETRLLVLFKKLLIQNKYR